jgi:hypothetical protein
MKRLLVLLIVLVVCGVVFARNIGYTRTRPPRLSLGAAYPLAMQALGKATNEFHCTDASLQFALSQDGEWFFTFWNTNGTHKWVTVEFGGKTHVEDIVIR